MYNHGFTSAGGSREINIGHEDKPRLMYVSAKSNPEYKLELIDLLKEVLFCLMRCLLWIDRSFNLWSEEFWCSLLIVIDEKYLKGYYPNI